MVPRERRNGEMEKWRNCTCFGYKLENFGTILGLIIFPEPSQ